jgi:DnaJ-class molecular chaperone
VTLDESLSLYRRLGIDVRSLSRKEFSAAYFDLARRFHPDRSPCTHELMANINAARTTILSSLRIDRAA